MSVEKGPESTDTDHREAEIERQDSESLKTARELAEETMSLARQRTDEEKRQRVESLKERGKTPGQRAMEFAQVGQEKGAAQAQFYEAIDMLSLADELNEGEKMKVLATAFSSQSTVHRVGQGSGAEARKYEAEAQKYRDNAVIMNRGVTVFEKQRKK